MPNPTDQLTGHLSLDQVAIDLGIPVPRLRHLRRNLDEGTHWIRDPEDDRRTIFTPAGLYALRGLAGIPDTKEPEAGSAGPSCHQGEAIVASAPPTHSEAEKPVSVAPANGDGAAVIEETLTVVSMPRQFPDGTVKHHPNPRVISARRETGEVVYVRVPESRHFISRLSDGTPMTLRARFDGTPPNWSLVGRCPRYFGRW